MSDDRRTAGEADLSPEDRELLALLLEREGLEAGTPPPIPRRPDPAVIPLSFAQERMWFLSVLEPGRPLYNIPLALRVEGRLDVEALRRALSTVVERHEVLRTGFETVGGRPLSVLGPAGGLVFHHEDLTREPIGERDAALARRVAIEARAAFDLAHGPFLRARLLRLGQEEHALLLTMHHIASDAWSLGVLVRELGVLYEAFAAGRPSPLPELKAQYADFAAWQRERLRGEALEEQLSYWKARLAGVPPVLDLPTDHARPALRSGRGGAVRRTLDLELLEDLRRLARREGVTTFMVLLAAFKVLLWRYSGQSDVVVGSPIAGRTRGDLEGLIGFFVNTLVLRTDVSGDPTFRELLARVKEVTLGAYAHQDVPFEKLVEELRPERALSHGPFFQVAFNLQNAPLGSLRLSGLSMSSLETTTDTAKFDLALYLTESPSGLRTIAEYDADLFEAATVERILSHYDVLLRGIRDRPGSRVSDLPLLTGPEWNAQSAWNATARDYPRGRCLHELVEARAARCPDAVAVEHGGSRLSYAELEARASRLAHRLRALGVGPEVRVGICLERSLDLVVALLATLKAGGAYVPLDPAYPTERTAFMLEDSGAAVLVTREGIAARLPPTGARVLCVEALAEAPSDARFDAAASGVREDNLAYVIYTSGSTGRPKGVAITHRSAATLVHWAAEALGTDDLDAVLASTSVCFDLSVFELFVPLAHGGRVVVVENVLQLGELPASAGVRLLNTVPSAIAKLLETTGLPPSVRTVCLAGEPLPTSLVDSIHATGTVERVFDLYGPSEDTTYSTFALRSPQGPETIGRPIANTQVFLLDLRGQPVPVGVSGEIHIGGEGLARGYLGRPDLTAERFVPDPFGGAPGGRLYRTGDLGRYLADGRIQFLGRLDHQVKVRGFRIELGEIETALRRHPAVRDVVVTARQDAPGGRGLVAYVAAEEGRSTGAAELREHLRLSLPEYMVPSAFVLLERLPLTPNGKVDRRALPSPEAHREPRAPRLAPSGEVERAVASVWGDLLGIARVGRDENFFDLGGHSLLLVQVHARLRGLFPEAELGIVDLFRYPTVRALAEALGAKRKPAGLERPGERRRHRPDGAREPIAIVGMAGRLPQARDLAEYWENLRSGRECVTFFTDEELRASGLSEEQLRDPAYVKARAVLDGVEMFDAAFFGYTPREAEVMDPQHRLFLETAWEALEDAGCDAERYAGLVGVYAGTSMNRYLQLLATRPDVTEAAGSLALLIGSDKDFLPTRVSYKLNLRGPSLTVQTACSTSLVAVHLACRALLAGECDMALAGGVSIAVPQRIGYRHQQESILSPDGHTRAFDARAQGTIAGSGVGVVVLKRLSDAVRDGDTIHAVVKGSAINNDGSGKVGYTAPGVEGQARVIRAALEAAAVEAETIGYVEAHGTGTALGDPIEVEALTQVFREETQRRGFCLLGSVKTNIGHLDAAAGVAGLIKAVLSVERGEVPPSLHYEKANPKIDFASSPFEVNTRLRPWASEGPRRAGVSSFGIGGTNAHVVLEEAPGAGPSEAAEEWQLLVLSGKTEGVLERARLNLRDHLESRPGANLADVSYTLQVGRGGFGHRRMAVVRDVKDAVVALGDEGRWEGGVVGEGRVAFVFPGQGSQHPGMGEGLYKKEGVYREAVDACAEVLRPWLGLDLREVMYPSAGEERASGERLRGTGLAQPALFVTEYALSRLWMSWGVEPVGMLGHSVGEYVAAHLSGVFTLEGALGLVAERGRLMESLPRGAMVAVPLGESELVPLLGEEISLAAVNGPGLCVASGPEEAVGGLEGRLRERGVASRRLHTSHAFHSGMMDPILERFEERVRRAQPREPGIRFVSNVTGDWITDAEATDAGYWTRHLRSCVRFGDGVERLLREVEGGVLLEVGPGRTLTTLSGAAARGRGVSVVSSLGGAREGEDERAAVLKALGRVWVSGAKVEWEKVHGRARRRRVPLPTYPFERQRYWVEAGAVRTSTAIVKSKDVASWFFLPSWTSSVTERFGGPRGTQAPAGSWLVLGEDEGPARPLAERLRSAGGRVVFARRGDRLQRESQDSFTLRPGAPEDYRALLGQLDGEGWSPRGVVHAWSAAPLEADASPAERLSREQERGFLSALFVVQALGRRASRDPVRLVLLSSGLHEVTGGEPLSPERLGILAIAKVAPQEDPRITSCSVDVGFPRGGAYDDETLDLLADECLSGAAGEVVALRQSRRWLQTFQPVRLAPPVPESLRLREGGAYLLTGGLGEIGLEVAERLARRVSARLVLVGRSGLPVRAEWDAWIEAHDEADQTRRRIERVRGLEAAGAQVLVAAGDVADLHRMREVWAEAEARFGRVDGVIHAAGLTRGRSIAPLLELGREECLEQLRAKAVGASVLEELLQGREPDFVVLMSSLSAVLGGITMGAYAAANLFLDGLAQRKRQAGDRAWTSVNWDAWQLRDETRRGPAGAGLAALALAPAEGTDALERILGARPTSQVVVSTADLKARFDLWVRLASRVEKQDPAARPAPQHPRPALATAYEAPGDETERSIAETWATLLGVARVGARDDFFDLGGHSLLATQIVSRLRESHGVEVSLRAFFEAPTVRGLARTIERLRGAREAPQAPPIVRASQAQGPVLSFAQQRLWFFDQLEPHSSAYNLSLSLRHRGSLRASALERALREVARRHEVLRTTLTTVDGRPVPHVESESSVSLPVIDLSGFAEAEREAEAHRLAREETGTPFDLARGPMLRASLLRLRPDDHVLLLTMHHIASDGWSIGVLFRELSPLYAAFSEGRPSPLPELPIQYADFARWQRAWLQGQALESQLEYWRRQLQGSPPKLEVPTDRPRPAVQTFRGATAKRTLPPGLSEAVKALGQAEGATLFMTLLAGFKVLLARLSGQDDVVVGTPIAGRNRAETECLIGFFINTLVLRTDLSGQPSFREALRRVREVCLGAYAHQDLPFERLVEELQPERDLGRTPLFQVVFNLLNLEANRPDTAGLPLEPFQDAAEDGHAPADVTSKFDLTLYANDRDGGIQLVAAYNADLFDRARIEILLEQIEHVLQQAVAAPDEATGRFSLVTPGTRALLPDPAEPLPRRADEIVSQRVSSWARQGGARVAVREEGRSWSYADLDAAATRLARHLRAEGVGTGDTVVIWARRSASLVWALLGVVEAGAAFTILDPAYPAPRLLACARQAEPRAWIGLAGAGEPTGDLAALRGHVACRVDLPDGIGGAGPWDGQRAAGPEAAPHPSTRAYVAFTSGSTGVPKGIVGTHGPLSHFLEWHCRTFELHGGDRFSMLSGLSHDPLLRDVFAPLWAGGTLCVPGRGDVTEGRLAEWMRREAITVAHLTPATARVLADTAGASAERPALESLRLAFFGGDVLKRGDVRRLRELAPRARCVNFYGATETPQAMGWHEVQADEPGEDREAIPIGSGIEGAQLLVLNSTGALAGVGELGEIHVRTPYLSEGYLGDEALTRERFLPDPASPGRERLERLYRSGDVGRYRPDGAVAYAGRNDLQVKLRGFRIEPGEIEAVLLEHPAVRQCVVVAAEGPGGETRLVAYVLAAGPVDPAALRACVAARLPDHMVPAAFVSLDRLPLTPNGKVDRGALPAADGVRLSASAYQAPRTPLEEVVARVWTELLGTESPGVDDTFFELGGHSLLVTQLVSRLRDAFRVELPLTTVFQRPTISGLAEALLEDAATRDRVQKTAEALLELAELSEAEVEARLDQAAGGPA
jgi:amino acid adenylation domain-containing protein